MDYKEYKDNYQEKSNPFVVILNSIKGIHILGFFIFFFLGYMFIKNNPDKKWVWFVIGGLVLLYIFSLLKKDKTKKLIPRHIAQRIAQEDLQREIVEGGIFPLGTKIIPNGYCFLQSLDTGSGFTPINWHFGFTIKEPSRKYEVRIRVHPFDGYVSGNIEETLGYSGGETQDIKFIPVEMSGYGKTDKSQNENVKGSKE